MSEPHPVLALLRERAKHRTRPGARADGQRLALALEGGGMRGVVSAGMASALERRRLLDCFDFAVGTSAGALNAAGFLAGVVEGCMLAYHGAFATRRFINPYRLLVGRAAIDAAFTLDHVDERLDAARHSRTVASDIPLHCIAVDVDTAVADDLTDLRTEDDLRCALLASSRMPWIGGEPVEFRGRRWLDGGLAEPIPHRMAVSLGATHVLVLMTRPLGVSRTPPPRLANRIIERRLRRLNPALVELYHRRTSDYEAAVREIAVATSEPDPRASCVYGLRLARPAQAVGEHMACDSRQPTFRLTTAEVERAPRDEGSRERDRRARVSSRIQGGRCRDRGDPASVNPSCAWLPPRGPASRPRDPSWGDPSSPSRVRTC